MSAAPTDSGGLLVVTAHPDDEVLIAGGTLAACAEAGHPTAVVCLTRGDQGPISDPALATPETLGRVRAAELEAACAELGVDWVKCYRRQDGNLLWSSRAGIVGQLERILRLRQPDAVVTFGEDGLYYHPDHIATYEFTLQAVQRLSDPPALYRSVWPKELMLSLGRELRRRGLSDDLWELEPEDFGTDDLNGSFAIASASTLVDAWQATAGAASRDGGTPSGCGDHRRFIRDRGCACARICRAWPRACAHRTAGAGSDQCR